MNRTRAAVSAALLGLASCSSLRYDLANVPFPVSATPARAGAAPGEPFERKDKLVLWGFGLFGETQPDVGARLVEACGKCDGVTDFRVSATASFHDWLVAHLTLGIVRMKTVTITGRRVA